MGAGTFKASVIGMTIAAALAAAAVAKDKAPPKTQDLLDQCGGRPAAPAIPGAESLDKDKLGHVKTDVQAFLRDADKFQECLALIIEAPCLTDNQKAQIVRLEDQIQSEKEVIGGQYNKMVDTVNARAGGAPKPAASPAAVSAPAQPASVVVPADAAVPVGRPTALAVPKQKPAVPAQ